MILKGLIFFSKCYIKSKLTLMFLLKTTDMQANILPEASSFLVRYSFSKSSTSPSSKMHSQLPQIPDLQEYGTGNF